MSSADISSQKSRVGLTICNAVSMTMTSNCTMLSQPSTVWRFRVRRSVSAPTVSNGKMENPFP